MGAPVELARVDEDAGDGGAVAADPLCGGVDDDVGAVLDGTDEVAAGAKGVVDLALLASPPAVYKNKNSKPSRLTIRGTPASCATLAMAFRSGTLYFGFPILSTNTALVFSSMAAAMASGLSPSTNFVSMPSRGM